MSVDVAWDFIRITPAEILRVREAFEQAVQQSQIADRAQAFFRVKRVKLER
jgi:hypothetical protein